MFLLPFPIYPFSQQQQRQHYNNNNKTTKQNKTKQETKTKKLGMWGFHEKFLKVLETSEYSEKFSLTWSSLFDRTST